MLKDSSHSTHRCCTSHPGSVGHIPCLSAHMHVGHALPADLTQAQSAARASSPICMQNTAGSRTCTPL